MDFPKTLSFTCTASLFSEPRESFDKKWGTSVCTIQVKKDSYALKLGTSLEILDLNTSRTWNIDLLDFLESFLSAHRDARDVK